MFKHSLYQFVPPLKSSQVVVALLWTLGVMFVSIGMYVAQAADAPIGVRPQAATGAFESPTPTPTSTPAPTRVSPIVSYSPADDARNAPGTQLRAGENRIRIERAGGAGRLYYRLRQNLVIAGTADRAAGPIGVAREYFDWKTERPITSAKVGDVISVRVTVSVTQDSWYVAIEDPLPAGLEAVNERLNTTAYSMQPEIYNGYAHQDGYRYRELGYNYKEIRDDRVVFFITQLSRGRHSLSYLARVTKAGTFSALPTQAYLMYEADQWGRSASGVVRIESEEMRLPVRPSSTVND